MPNLEWDVGQRIVAPLGTLLLNQPDADTGYLYRVRFDGYQIVPQLRLTQDNISQQDGSVLHTRYTSGLVATMMVTYFVTISGTDANPVDVEPACGNDLRLMHEHAMLVLNNLRELDSTLPQRYFWQPTGYGDERMLTDIQIASWPQPSYENDGGEASITFSLETPFPYAIDSTQIEPPDAGTTISAGGSSTLANAGNSPTYPVFKLNGPVGAATTIANVTTGLQITYDPTLPGAVAISGGDFVEIDTFRGTAFLNGDVSDRIAGIAPLLTDFFAMVPGDNDISLTGDGTVDVLYNNAWA